MLRDYLNQNVVWKRQIGSNEYNEPIFEENYIRCRLVNGYKVVTNEKGDEVVSSGVVQCLERIKAGDVIDDKKIISVNYATSLDEIIGYKGYLL